jgi:hypothetical protein
MTSDQPRPPHRTAPAPAHSREATSGSTPEVAKAAARVQDAAGLPELLSASFDAFEVIRRLCRSHEDQAAELLPTFMTAADAAVDGREAVTAAPSLARAGRSAPPPGAAAAQTALTEVTDGLAALGALIGERLSASVALASAAADRAACREAARAAQRISGLLARGDDDRLPG